MIRLQNCLIIIGVLIFQNTAAQSAGNSAFAFINMPSSAREMALGSNLVCGSNTDLGQLWNNPASRTSQMNNTLMGSYNRYVSDIKSGFFCYAGQIKHKRSFALGLLYNDYGQFKGMDETGIATGNFSAQDQCFFLSYKSKVGHKGHWGINTKYIYSIYEAFVSNGLSTDLSYMYEDTSKKFNVTGFARNIGFQTIPYAGTRRQNLPFELALNLSKQLAHLPFRYQIILHHLQEPDMRYTITNTGQKDEFGKDKVAKMTMGDNILRHINFAGELFLSKQLTFRMGYNHMRRKEMTQEQKRGAAGFSWGLGLNYKKMELAYGSASYFAGQNANQFSVLLKLSEFYKTK